MKKEFGGYEVPGPGEVISEFCLGLRIEILEGKITPPEAQEFFNMKQREIMLFAVLNPNYPWETGSTQVRELELRKKELRANPLPLRP